MIMAMQDDLRAQLIKQLPSEVVENVDTTGAMYYACPSCHRPVAMGQSKCNGCSQTLSWENVKKDAERKGQKRARIEFDLPLDFTPGNCRKCPLSYIGKSAGENVYECPLGWKNICKIQIV